MMLIWPMMFWKAAAIGRRPRCTFLFLSLFPWLYVCGESVNSSEPALPPYQVIMDEQSRDFIDIECHLYQPVPPQIAYAILRAELAKLSADRIKKRDVMASAWLRNAHDKELADTITLPDGSITLFMDPASRKIITGKEKAIAEIPLVSPDSLIDVGFTVAGRRLPNGGISVFGKTNLPDGCAIIVSFVNGGDAKVMVQGGQFASEGFTWLGETYPAGTYSIALTVPIARTQSISVQEKIGKKGERLGGKYADTSEIGRTVRYTGTITVD
jgi:hypothetical protein